jgi:hypothetical protein
MSRIVIVIFEHISSIPLGNDKQLIAWHYIMYATVTVTFDMNVHD